MLYPVHTVQPQTIDFQCTLVTFLISPRQTCKFHKATFFFTSFTFAFVKGMWSHIFNLDAPCNWSGHMSENYFSFFIHLFWITASPFLQLHKVPLIFITKKETWSDNLLHSQIAANLKGLPHHASRILQSFITGHAVARMTPQGYAIDSQLRTSMAVMQVEKEQPSGYLFPATVLHLTSLNCSIRPLTCQCLLSMPLPFSLFAFLPIHLTPSAPLPSKTCLQFKAQLHFSPPLTLLTVKVCISLDLTWDVFSGSCTIFIDSLKMVFLSTALIASTSHFPIKGDYVWKKDDSWTSRHSCIYAALHIHQKNPKPCHHLWEHQSPSNAWWASTCGCQLLNCPAAWSLKGRNGNETKFFLRHLDLESAAFNWDSEIPTKVQSLNFLLMIDCECFCKVMLGCNTPWFDSFPPDIGGKLFAVGSDLKKVHPELLKLLKADCQEVFESQLTYHMVLLLRNLAFFLWILHLLVG